MLNYSAPVGSNGDLMVAFFEAVRRNPDGTAIVHDGKELSYAELARRVGALALRLGANCGNVAVLVTRSPSTIVALLGVMAAGGGYCPIDPTFPAARQRDMARAAGCRRAICTERGQQPPPGLDVVEVPAHAEDPDWILTRTSERAPAYILFTSGSTGAPKAVVTPRGAISAAVHSLRDLFAISAADRVLQFASLNWDTCFEEIFPTLTAGAALVIDREAHTGLLPRMLRVIATRQVSVIDLPTAVWHELVHYLAEEKVSLPSNLRLVVIGGEAARPYRLADWCALDTERIRLVNTYGCTETTLVTHATDLHGPLVTTGARSWRTSHAVPIGRALPHVEEHIGIDGELLIGGPSLALGYSGAPELTDERFSELDLGSGRRRYFRTGDRVDRDEYGELIHRGRVDGQIKVRGIRVDPTEVEAEVSRHSAVAAVAVTGVMVADHMALKAYVVPCAGADLSTLSADLLADLRARAPSHLVPSQVVLVPELVYTASGKIDRAGPYRRHGAPTKQEEASR